MDRTACLVGILLLGCVAQPVAATEEDGPLVEVAQLAAANWQKFVPQGKEVDAVIGDIVLRNGYLTAVIAQPLESRHANARVRSVGGALIDLATRVNGSDQLQAFYPGQKQFAFRKWRMLDQERTEVQTESSSPNQLRVEVSSAATAELPEVRVEYILESDEPILVVVTTFTNRTDKPMTVPLADDIRFDPAQESFAKVPDGVSSLFWAYDRHWNQAYGIFSLSLLHEMRSPDMTKSSISETSLRYRANNGQSSVTLEPQASFHFSRWILPASSLLDIKSAVLELQGDDLELVKLRATGGGKPIPQAEITLQRNGIFYGTATTDDAGLFETQMPVGSYSATVSALGLPLKPDKPLKAIVVAGLGGTLKLEIPQYRPGRLNARITDAQGAPLPCKVEIQATGGKPQPDFGPETGDFGVRNLRYCVGSFEQALPPGEYDVIVSHGPEYSAVFAKITIEPGETIDLVAKMERSVDTTGWISADFNSQCTYSGDNTCSPEGRILNLVAEQVEFAPSTELNRIVSYSPLLGSLQATPWLATASGIRLASPSTSAPNSSVNAFPLRLLALTQDGGAPAEVDGPAPQFDRLAGEDNGSELVMQANDPGTLWQFYDQDGDGNPDTEFSQRVSRFHLLEIQPLEVALRLQPTVEIGGQQVSNPVFAWLQLLNHGARIAAAANSTVPTNFHGSGRSRNWVRSSTDDPASIKTPDIVRAARQGQLIVSNGPFLEVSGLEAGQSKEAHPGEDLPAASGKIELKVRVQCPNWLDVDRVTVLVNGRPHATHQYSRATHAEKFRDAGAVRFEERLLLELKEDSHVIAVTAGEKLSLGPVAGPKMKDTPPVALSNPIFVDVDGGGFKANQDGLGHPLPLPKVK